MNPIHALNVLVVDDELPIRQGLRMFDWNSCGAALIGEAENGEEAFDMCRDYPPDIVITDIAMPVMDGIELLKRLKLEYPYIQVIILTCHSDFEYARQALEYGAIGYIPKASMGDREILQAVEKARTILEKEILYRKSEIEFRRLEQSKSFRKMIFGGHEVKEAGGQISSHGLGIRVPTRFICMCVEHCPKDWIFLDKEISACLNNAGENIQWFPSDVGEYILYLNGGEKEDESLKQYMDELVGAVVDGIEKAVSFIDDKVYVYAIIGGKAQNEQEYLNSYGIVKKWKSLSFYDWGSRVLTGEPPRLEHLSNCNVNIIEEKIRKNWSDYDKLTKFFRDEFSEWVLKQNPPPEELKEYIIKLVDLLEQKTRIVGAEDEFIKSVREANRFSQLTDILLHHVEKKFSTGEKHHPHVQLAIKIISEKLREPITLASVAWEVGTTPQYLSRLFFKENGETFNKYLTRRRMEKSLDLLKNSDLKVYEVAEEVGIPNYRYFSVLFREWTGMTPKECRKQ